MGGPRASKTAKTKGHGSEEKREESLLAVVLADSFQSRFRPFTYSKPRCLLPLANSPIIEYTLEFLAANGVQEVLIYACNHTEQVEEYIRTSKWTMASSPFKEINVLRSVATSVGDCMRDLDARDLVAGDFLIVFGDVVSNFDLGPALTRHKARKMKSKDAIMTLILQEDMSGSRRRRDSLNARRSRRPVFVIDPTSDRCLHYEEMDRRRHGHRIVLEPDMLRDHARLQIRDDLIDPHIDICTPDVLAQWSDNFDYQTLRTSFLFGVLKDHELNGKTIHTHLVRSGYVARAFDRVAYQAVLADVLARKTFPYCPDSNLLRDHSYKVSRSSIYQENNVKISDSANISGPTILGSRTSVGDESTISYSSVGRNCRIGKHVKITNAVLWNNVTVHDHAEIHGYVIIADNAVVGRAAQIKPGALIADSAAITDNAPISGQVLGPARIGASADAEDESEADSDPDLDVNWDLSSFKPHAHVVYKNASGASSESSLSSFADSEDSEEMDHARLRRGSSTSVISDDGIFPSSTTGAGTTSSSSTSTDRKFQNEAGNNILEGMTDGHAADTIFLELNGYRMSVDASPQDVRQAVVTAFMRRIAALGGSRDSIHSLFTTYGTLMHRLVLDKNENKKHDQVNILLLLQKDAASRSRGDQLLLYIAKEMYDGDILEEDAILQWWEDERATTTDELRRVRHLTEQFITYLREAEEDEDDEDEEDEDED